MIERLLPDRVRASTGWLVVAIAVVIGCWILGNPRSSGPDEPSHMVASAALVRGERDGRADPARAGYTLFLVPAMVGAPDPACWSTSVGLDPNVPVTCATTQELTTDEQFVGTSSENYPPWGFVLPGLASYVPDAGLYAYLARALNALVPLVLVGWSVSNLTRHRRILGVAALAGLTPIAWFTFGVVNPSAVAIAGGMALWAGVLVPSGPRATWLATAGWVALMLPRRDGPVWVLLIVLACCWLTGRRPAELWRSLSIPQRSAVVVAALLAPVTPLWNGETNLNLALSVAPLGLVVVDVLAQQYRRRTNPDERRAIVGGSALAVVLALGIAVTLRPGGFDANVVRLVVTATGEHLRQLVGVLGWLSTPVPPSMVFLQWALVGGLATVAYLECRRAALVGAGALAAAIVTAWVLELGQGADYGRYWHGRYTMPLAVGLPIVLAWRAGRAVPEAGAGPGFESGDDETLVDRLVPVVAVVAWIVSNVAFAAAQQRWAVGNGGTWYPWRWNTWDAPIWPPALLVFHALASGVAIAWCAGARSDQDRSDQDRVAA